MSFMYLHSNRQTENKNKEQGASRNSVLTEFDQVFQADILLKMNTMHTSC